MKPQKLQQAPFNAAGFGRCFEGSTFSLTHTTETHKNAFLDSILANELDKVVVLTFDR
jgi:hypothetical protein